MKKIEIAILIFGVVVINPIVTRHSVAQETPEKGEVTYVGSQGCETCHADLVKEFWRTSIGKAFLKPRNPAEEKGCEACHGPASAHLEDPSTGVMGFKKEKPKDINTRCLECHQQENAVAFWRKSAHNRSDLSCVSCHKIHGAETPFLLKPEKEQCTGCHKSVEGTFKMPSRHPIKEGKVVCSDCHNPHQSQNKRTGVSLQQSCTGCHQEKRGPFVYSHRPVAQNCLSCHSPHGSANPHLLTLRQPSLCVQCHAVLPETHNIGAGLFRECMNCHKDIHGSNRNRRFFP